MLLVKLMEMKLKILLKKCCLRECRSRKLYLFNDQWGTKAMELHLFIPCSPIFRIAIMVMIFVIYFEKTLILKHFIGKSY